jgi:hypothetical protein
VQTKHIKISHFFFSNDKTAKLVTLEIQIPQSKHLERAEIILYLDEEECDYTYFYNLAVV